MFERSPERFVEGRDGRLEPRREGRALAEAARAGEHVGLGRVVDLVLEDLDNTLVETYVDLFGAENVLVVISETMRRHRDQVLEEIHDFLGVDRVPTSLPVMNVCKKDRYGGTFEGCYNGSSKVLPATRAVWRPFFEGCNARLAASFGVSPEALFAGRPTRRRLPP